MTARTALSSSLVKAAAGSSRSRSHAFQTSRVNVPQLPRPFATSTAASNSTHNQSTSQTVSSSSSTSDSTSGSAHHRQGSTRNTAPDASTLLLLNTLPHVPRYGFTKQAYFRSPTTSSSSSQIQAIDPEELNKRMRIASTLFPGPNSVFDGKLFQAWSRVCDLSTIHSSSPDQIIRSLKNAVELDSGTDGKPVRTQRSLSSQEESVALQKVAALIEERLRLSWQVRAHLMHGITALSTASPTSSRLHSIFPHETILPNLPNPAPLLNLTSEFVETVLTSPDTQERTGWMDPDGPNWYAVRSRLTLAYTAATLHAALPSVEHFQDTQRVFQRIVRARDTGLAATLGGLAQSSGEWVRWGGRGWLGILRSLGL